MHPTAAGRSSRHSDIRAAAPRRLVLNSVTLLSAALVLTSCADAEPEVVTETATETVTEEVEVEPADLAEQRETADERDDELETREEDVSADELELEANTIPGSGTYLVGEDIQPGTYRTTLDGSSSCYWARLAGLSGELGDIIANDNVSGQAFVTIAETDVAFETSRCGEWVLE